MNQAAKNNTFATKEEAFAEALKTVLNNVHSLRIKYPPGAPGDCYFDRGVPSVPAAADILSQYDTKLIPWAHYYVRLGKFLDEYSVQLDRANEVPALLSKTVKG